MGGSFDTENRRLTGHATAGDTEWGTPLRGSACDAHARTLSRGLDGTTPVATGRPGSRTSGFLGSA